MRDLNLNSFVLSVLFFHGSYFSSKKFSVITSIVSKSVNNVAYINYFSLLFSNLIPFGPTADIYKTYVLKSNYNFPITKCLIVVLIDRISSLIVISILGIIFYY